jgi:hypothetical protein
MDREPEPWQVTHPPPFLAVEDWDVAVWALGDQRFRVEHPDALRRSRALSGLGS